MDVDLGFVDGDFGEVVEGFVAELGVVNEHNFVAGLAFVDENVFEHADELQVLDLGPDLLAELPNEGLAAVLTELHPAAKGPSKPVALRRIESLANQYTFAAAEQTDNDRADAVFVHVRLGISANRPKKEKSPGGFYAIRAFSVDAAN